MITVYADYGSIVATCQVTVNVPVTGITLNKSSLSLNKDATETLVGTISPEDASNMKFTWSSSNPAIAKVDTNGLVTAVDKGVCNITVTTADGAKIAICEITVKIPVAGVTLNKTVLSLNKGNTETLTATILPADTTNEAVTWSSSKNAIATVDTNGKVTAVGGRILHNNSYNC